MALDVLMCWLEEAWITQLDCDLGFDLVDAVARLSHESTTRILKKKKKDIEGEQKIFKLVFLLRFESK